MSGSPMETHGMFSWCGHSSAAPDKAKAFYASVLGWTIADQEMGDGSHYSVITVGEQPIGGFPAQPDGDGQWLPYVTVDDVDKRVAAAEKAGGTVVSPAVSVPGVGRMATIADPMGAKIAFIAYGA